MAQEGCCRVWPQRVGIVDLGVTSPFSPMADLEAARVWSQLANAKDPELQQLALEVPDTLLGGKADSTVKKYIGAFRRWKLWAEARQEVPSFPVQEAHICPIPATSEPCGAV